ncbi:hypothetical protein KSC_032210 [Ktedonobacter sp. SOSP1-52]|nr:hypothetical protein KSC_032210 [Ktedonobacter sp. SOSP1-52]
MQGHLLHKYLFSYEQTQPQTITDPLTGSQESVAGYLDLTQIQEQGTNGTTLNAPVINISYSTLPQRYVDLWRNASSAATCPSWTTSNGGGCVLWETSYNGRYITTLDNGRGWHENVSWNEAHGNTHGVSSGNPNDPFACNGHQAAGTTCGTADDHSWSREVVTSRSSVTNGVTSSWKYQYGVNGGELSWCTDCNYGYTWGNQNDTDYADYYNGQFTSFANAQVTQPDNSYQIEYFASTSGWGVAPGVQCYTSPTTNPCHDQPYWYDPGMAGHLKTEEDFSSTGQLLKVKQLNPATNCSPPGVGHTETAYGGGVGPANGNPGDTKLISLLDQNNPVVVCDPRATQEDDYQVDGVTDLGHYTTDARVLHKTITTSYDGDNQGVGTYDYGNVSKVDVTANDVGGAHFITRNTFYPKDNIGSGQYLTDLSAQSFLQDASNNIYSCTASVYGSNTAYNQAPTLPQATQNIAYLTNGGCTGSSVTVKHGYDASGTPITGIDGDNHLGCTSGSSQYSACATYDTFDAHLLTAANAKNQTVTYTYDANSANGGFGQWLLSETDANGQTTSYQYDALGRLTAVIRPGDSANYPTISYTYNNTCTNGSTVPCVEIDATARVTSGNTRTTTTQQWYDGLGRLVETKKPGPNMLSKVPAIPSALISYTIYDNMGRATTKNMPYAVSALTSGYVTPDLNQPRTVTSYDSLGRSLGTITYGDATTIMQEVSTSYTVAQGVATLSSENSTAYEQSIALDAYNHQSITYTDALGRSRYSQVFNGASSPYTVIRTVGKTYDTVGNTLSVQTYDSTGAVKANYSASYDALKRISGFNDSDSGSCQNVPLPANCSGSTDLAWKYSYDADGNPLSQTDPRNKSVFVSYDALDRPLCKGATSASVNPCSNSAYDIFFYDSYDNSSNSSVTFPSNCAASGQSYAVKMSTAEVFSSTAGSGWRCKAYDQRGQQTLSMLSVSADSQTTTQAVYSSYNEVGQVIDVTYPDGENVTSQYDNNDYLRSSYFGSPTSSDPVNFLVGQVTYTNNGLVAGMGMGGSASKASTPTPVFSTSTTYDNIQRPQTISASKGGNTLWDQTRTLDNVGNVIGLTTSLPTTTGGTQTDVQSFCYDSLSRLVWAGNTGTPTGGDHCGNTPAGSTISTYQQQFSYDSLDRFNLGPGGSTTYDTNHVHGASTLLTS